MAYVLSEFCRSGVSAAAHALHCNLVLQQCSQAPDAVQASCIIKYADTTLYQVSTSGHVLQQFARLSERLAAAWLWLTAYSR